MTFVLFFFVKGKNKKKNEGMFKERIGIGQNKGGNRREEKGVSKNEVINVYEVNERDKRERKRKKLRKRNRENGKRNRKKIE